MRKVRTQISILIGLAVLLAGGFTLLAQAAQARYPAETRSAAQAPPGQSAPQRRPSGPVGAVNVHPPANPAVVLYDQLNNIGTANGVSERETTGDPDFDNQGADDFVVPAGQSWTIDLVEVDGSYYNGTGPADSVNVYFFTNAGSLPGTQIYSRMNIAPTGGLAAGDFVLPLSPGPTLGPGTYWVSVQANMTFLANGQWGWTTRTIGAGSPAAWINPGDGYSTGCTAWGVRGTCIGTPNEPDNPFRLSGTSGAPGSPTPGATATTAPATATSGPTNTPGGPTATVTPCAITFTDVDQSNPFYAFIRCLACRQIVSGYSDGTFRWGNEVTRGQLSKIIAGAANLQNAIPSTQQTFEDVPSSNTFWLFIERLSTIGAISGYACGGPGEPCGSGNKPYFRWGNNATRGQISKITGVTAGWNGPIPTTQQTFEDVPPTNAFWTWIEELAARSIISGYACGGPGEPCGPGNRPYFRWGNNATRGQMSKIGASAFFPNCATPAGAASR